jgi:hypothetical protein
MHFAILSPLKEGEKKKRKRKQGARSHVHGGVVSNHKVNRPREKERKIERAREREREREREIAQSNAPIAPI